MQEYGFPDIQPLTRLIAPWTDYAGNTIRAGDTIRHPKGTTGVVMKLNEDACDEDVWLVKYGEDKYGRLCLQIGDKGQAVVVKDIDFWATKGHNTNNKSKLKQ